MSRILGRNTSPELELRRALWKRGLRYSPRTRLPGNPDLAFPRYKTAVFIDGCFWHKCPLHYVRPKTNAGFWARKIKSNVRRDRLVNATLRQMAWVVIRVWEHEVKKNPELVASRIQSRIRKQKGGIRERGALGSRATVKQ